MKISFNYKTFVIIPTKDPSLFYKWTAIHKGGKVVLSNFHELKEACLKIDNYLEMTGYNEPVDIEF